MTEWDRILPEKVYSPKEPDEPVASFISSLKKRRARVLDLACGAGRHVIFVAEQGFEANGADISGTGLKLTKGRLRKRRLHAALMKCDMRHLPYRNHCFDVVICTRAIYHQRQEAVKATLSEIHRILTKGGFALVDFLSRRTYSYGKGVTVEKDTFLETEGHENGVLHYFVGKEELKLLLGRFKSVKITLEEHEVDGKLRSRWFVTATT